MKTLLITRVAAAGAVVAGLAACGGGPSPVTGWLAGKDWTYIPTTRRVFRIGDHTITHPYLTRLSDAAVRQEILGVTGKNPAPLLRFRSATPTPAPSPWPTGPGTCRWIVDTLGWEGTAGHISPSVVAARGAGRRQARRDRLDARRIQPR